MDNKLFYAGLAASLLIHTFVIAYMFSAAAGISLQPQPRQGMEVTYQMLQPQPPPAKSLVREVKAASAARPIKDVEVFSKKAEGFPATVNDVKDISRFGVKPYPEKKQAPQIAALDAGRKITVPLLTAEKMTNPRYLSYNQQIRRRIEERAYTYVHHPDFASGEVYLTFVLDSGGGLKGIQIIREKTSANLYLQQAGLRSIEESAPFPSFPQDLDYPELTFNVIISFEVISGVEAAGLVR